MSAIADALDALVATWQALDLNLTIDGTVTPVQVCDGPPWDPGVDFLAIGWDRTGQPGVVGDGASEDLGGDRERETFDVSCLLAAWFGGPGRDVSAVRRAQLDALKQLRAALDTLVANRTVAEAEVTTRELTFTEAESGVASDLRFDVHITAYGV